MRAWRVGGISEETVDTQFGCARFGACFESIGVRRSDSRCKGAVRRGVYGRALQMWYMRWH